MRTNLTENGERNVVKGENHMENNRAQWGSKIGRAVGLGNIWKFPGKAFEGGGGAYILI